MRPRFPVRFKHFLLLAMVCLIAVLLLEGQSVLKGQSAPPAEVEEFKVISQAYVPQDAHAIRIQSTMVEVNVVVRDAKGDPISGLKREDFEVYDQGKQQKISSFTAELAHPPVVPPPAVAETAAAPPVPPPPAPPRYLGMYFDDQNMSAGQMVYIRKAAEAYVNRNMQETDRAAIFTSSETVTQQFTSSKQQVLDALAKLLSHTHGDSVPGCPIITPYQAYEIELMFNEHNDATDLAVSEALACHVCSTAQDCMRFVETRAATVLSLNENNAQDSLGVLGDIIRYMGRMPGQRTLIMASAGFFSLGQKVQHAQDKMIDSAIHNGIIINTLDAKGLTAGFDPSEMGANGEQMIARQQGNGYAGMLADIENEVSDDPMAAIAYGTGGKFFHNNNDMTTGLRQMAEVPEASYVLGFSPEEVKDNGVFHNLKVKVPGQHEVTIAARPGYFALSKEEAAPGAKFQKLNKEVMGSDTLSEISSDVTTTSGTLATGEPALRVTVHVPGKSMQFKKENKRHIERIIFVSALFDMQDHYLAGNEVVMDMKLKDTAHTNIARDGVDAKSTFQAPSGTYRLRQIVQEVVGGKTSAISRTVEIR
jgi:VWFA-related protein